ncbi:MAG: amylo-alpha-1,6-glucosidase [Planctomycetes bacterium]|nr:amylo-alpha-1,6-glucosidase [Planctomycetota bacterium]
MTAPRRKTDIHTPDEPAKTTHDIAVTSSPRALLDHEWTIANGTGAFAMGTLPGANTRRYHALFIAATRPPVGRIVALNQVLEQLAAPGSSVERPIAQFSTCLFRDGGGQPIAVPDGWEFLHRFERGLGVAWTLRQAGVILRRELSLHWKQQAATLRYVIRPDDTQAPPDAPRPAKREGAARSPGYVAPEKLALRLWPMLTLRDFHALLRRESPDARIAMTQGLDAITARRVVGDETVEVTVRCPDSRFVPNSIWWDRVFYPADAERGQDDHEDYFLPGYFETIINPREGESVIEMTVALGAQPATPSDHGRARGAHLRPIAAALSLPSADLLHKHEIDADALRRALAVATDDFVVDRAVAGEKLATVIAGYPWFADWGRDTFISLSGLMLATGRFDEARSTLRAFARHVVNGLVPNKFDDYNDQAAAYNTVDASLWFIHAAMEYVHVSKDSAAWRDWLADACMSIIDAYIKGTNAPVHAGGGADAPIRMAGDGLISAGTPVTQLTWMDAMTNGVVFTPRHGKAVEINALWYHALIGLSAVLKATHKAQSDHYHRLAQRVGRAFPKVFWDEDRQCLFDHVWTDAENVDHPDPALRPNQIFAVSVFNSPIPRTRQTKVLELVRSELLTPVGLRTLPTDDPGCLTRFTGPQFERDRAYHQGTIWPWLIGPYAEGVLRGGRFSDKARDEALEAIAPLLREMLGRGLGQLPEICEAQTPFRPVGCPAQAWSVAQVARVLAMLQGDVFNPG